jgi:hypothetical protein
MITKTYYLDRNAKGYKSTIEHIKETIPCFTTAKPVEMDFVEWTFEVRNEDIKTLEKLIAPIV